MSVPASSLPSSMLARKAKLAAAENTVVLPSMEAQRVPLKPVVVNSVPVKKDEEKKDEELDLKEFTVDGKEDGVVDPTKIEEVKPTVVVEKKDDDESAGDNRDWRWMYKSLEGNHQLLVKENRDIRDKFVELETKFNALGEKKVIETKPDLSLELTPEENEQYSDAIPVLNKLLTKQQRQIEQSIIKPLQNEIAELKSSTKSVADRSIATDEGNFVQQVRMQVKNIGSDFDAIMKNPKWGEFTNRTIGDYTDITIGQALLDAHKKRDLDKVVKVFQNFVKSEPTASAGDAYRAPSVSAATGALPSSDEKKPMLKWSKRKEVSEQFKKRQISLVDYEKVVKLYREAQEENRIDFTK